LSRLSKDITRAEWDKFIGSDLADNATVRIEPGSTIRQSEFLRQNLILNLAKAGMLPEVMGDPIARKNFLEMFNLSDLLTDSNADVQSAEFAIDQMLDGKLPPLLDIYNADIHLLVLARYMKKPKFLELPDNIKIIFDKRKEDLMRTLAESINRAPTVSGEEPSVTEIQKPEPAAAGVGKGPAQDAMMAEEAI
jgi:hypothetical protein